jgi:hypothetical protein
LESRRRVALRPSSRAAGGSSCAPSANKFGVIDLSDAYAKRDWAREHMHRLLALQAEPNRCSFTTEVNEDRTTFQLIFHAPEEPPSDWALMFGDCLFNFRCALDSAVYAMAVEERGTDPPPGERQLMFPITYSAEKWRGIRWHIKTLCVDCRALIKSLQPHMAEKEKSPLAWLEDLHTSDKHRRLSVAFDAVIGHDHLIDAHRPGPVDMTLTYATSRLKDGAAVVTLNTATPCPDMELHFKVTIGVSIRQGSSDEPWWNLPLALHGIDRYVSEALDKIATDFPHGADP